MKNPNPKKAEMEDSYAIRINRLCDKTSRTMLGDHGRVFDMKVM